MFYRIVEPENRLVNGNQILEWAERDIAQGLASRPGKHPLTIAQAIEILKATGTVRFLGDA